MAKAQEKTKDAELAVIDLKTRDAIRLRGASLFFDVAKFEHAQRVATLFAHSTMVPGHFRGNIGNCVIALNYAERMGLDPFMLMQNMYVVHGRPGVEAKMAIALINGCGRFEPLEYEHGTDKERGQWCRAYAKDIKSGKVLKGPQVDWKMVTDEGWNKDKTNKQTGEVLKSKWNSMRDLMFEYRAAMFFARTRCPEVLLGLQTTEEILDFVEMEPGENGAYTVKEKTETKLASLKSRLGVNGEDKQAEAKESEPEQPATLYDEAKNLRKPGYADWVHKNISRIQNAPEADRDKLQAKWIEFYDELWPLVVKNVETVTPKEDNGEDWNGLFYGCPDMDGNAIPKTRCRPENCKKYDGCPDAFKPGEVKK